MSATRDRAGCRLGNGLEPGGPPNRHRASLRQPLISKQCGSTTPDNSRRQFPTSTKCWNGIRATRRTLNLRGICYLRTEQPEKALADFDRINANTLRFMKGFGDRFGIDSPAYPEAYGKPRERPTHDGSGPGGLSRAS